MTQTEAFQSSIILPDTPTTGSSRALLEHTRNKILSDFPGVDHDALEKMKTQFDSWLTKTGITPQHYSSELYGFIKNKLTVTQS